VRRVAELLGFLDLLAQKQVVLDDDQVLRDARHLAHRGANVLEVVRRDAARDDVERVVREGNVLGARDDGRLHAGCGIDADDVAARLAQPPRNVPAAGRDVERLYALARLAPLDHQVEVGALAMRRALAEGLGAL
jgi:hypothetical protein